MPTINQFKAPDSPLKNLLEIGALGSQIYTGFKQRDLLEQEAQQKQLANQQAGYEAEQNKALQEALKKKNTPETEGLKSLGVARLSSINNILGNQPGTEPLKAAIAKLQEPGAIPGVEGQQIQENPNALSGIQVNQILNSPQIKGLQDLAEAKLKGEYTVKAADAKATVMKPLAEARMASVENQKDRIAAEAANHFDNDKKLVGINKQRQQVALDRHTIESGQLTPQLLAEVQQGIGRAISGGGGGVHEREAVALKTGQEQLARIMERVKSEPQYINNPEVKNYLLNTIDRLDEAYAQNAEARAKQIYNGRAKAYKSNPAAVEVMKSKVEDYKLPEQSKAAAPAINADLSKMTDDQLKEYIRTHGGQ